jgi:hypothetical protein
MSLSMAAYNCGKCQKIRYALKHGESTEVQDPLVAADMYRDNAIGNLEREKINNDQTRMHIKMMRAQDDKKVLEESPSVKNDMKRTHQSNLQVYRSIKGCETCDFEKPYIENGIRMLKRHFGDVIEINMIDE